jgi:hypothetical protein
MTFPDAGRIPDHAIHRDTERSANDGNTRVKERPA